MLTMVLGCALLLVATTLVHYEALRLVSAALPLLPPRVSLIFAVLGMFAAHLVEISLYAAAAWWAVHTLGLGSLGLAPGPSFGMALYFSAETFTSLGYGDVVPQGPLRMLAGVEALNGLLLIGWSASFLFVAMERFWVQPAAPRSGPR